jgi:hypothetical protein
LPPPPVAPAETRRTAARTPAARCPVPGPTCLLC